MGELSKGLRIQRYSFVVDCRWQDFVYLVIPCGCVGVLVCVCVGVQVGVCVWVGACVLVGLCARVCVCAGGCVHFVMSLISFD